jgi:hypothetical protein
MCNKDTTYPIHPHLNTTTNRQNTNKKTSWLQGLKYQHFTMDSVSPLIVTTNRGLSSQTTVHNPPKEAPPTENKASLLRKVYMKRFLIRDIPSSMKDKLILMVMLRILSFESIFLSVYFLSKVGFFYFCYLRFNKIT